MIAIQKKICNGHHLAAIYEILPPTNTIDSIKNEIIENKKYINVLNESINIWIEKFMEKINSLKKKLEKLNIIFEKLFSRFNTNFLNLNYCNNFKYFKGLFKNSKNKILYEFYNSFNLENQTKYLIKALFPQNSIKKKSGNCKKVFSNKFMKKINEAYFFVIDNEKAYIKNFNKIEENYCETELQFYNIVYSLSNGKNKIFCSLLNEKKIKIFKYSIKEKYLKLLNEEIKENNNNDDNNYYFNKCI